MSIGSRVQSKTANSGASAPSSLTLTFDAPLTVGNIVVVCGGSTGAGAPFVNNSSSVVWLGTPFRPASSTSSSTLATSGLFFGLVRASVSSVTINFYSGASCAAVAAEYANSGNFFVDASGGVGTTTAATSLSQSASLATTSASGLWLATFCLRGSSTFSSPTNGFSIVDQAASTATGGNDKSVVLLEYFPTATGTPSAGVTGSGSALYCGCIAALAPVPSGGGTSFSGVSRGRMIN